MTPEQIKNQNYALDIIDSLTAFVRYWNVDNDMENMKQSLANCQLQIEYLKKIVNEQSENN